MGSSIGLDEGAEREKAVPAKCLKQVPSATPSALEYSLTGGRQDHRTAIGFHLIQL
jgi:hypothetical protein